MKVKTMSKITDYTKAIFLIFICIQIIPKIASSIQKEWLYNLEVHNKIGYVLIDKNITNASFYRESIINSFKDPSIKAILLKIECNDGAAGSCQALAFDIENIKKQYPKPIIAYIENICTAGGYQIAAATDHIVSTGSAIIGGIGSKVVAPCKAQEILKEQNITCEEINSGSCKSINSLTDEQRITLQQLSDNIYQQFAKEIASKRHLQLNKIDQWGCSKLFTGQQAYDLKLVDSIGSRTTAINLIKKNIIPSDRKIEWITYQPQSSFSRWWNSSDRKSENDNLESNSVSLSNSFVKDFFIHLNQ